jgi:hypothetical protein
MKVVIYLESECKAYQWFINTVLLGKVENTSGYSMQINTEAITWCCFLKFQKEINPLFPEEQMKY